MWNAGPTGSSAEKGGTYSLKGQVLDLCYPRQWGHDRPQYRQSTTSRQLPVWTRRPEPSPIFQLGCAFSLLNSKSSLPLTEGWLAKTFSYSAFFFLKFLDGVLEAHVLNLMIATLSISSLVAYGNLCFSRSASSAVDPPPENKLEERRIKTPPFLATNKWGLVEEGTPDLAVSLTRNVASSGESRRG